MAIFRKFFIPAALAAGLFLFSPFLRADENPEDGDVLKGETAQAGGESLSAEELLKTPAGEAFIIGDYPKAVGEFKLLVAKYPKDIKIKRYLGASHFHLKQYDEAASFFKEALGLDPQDLPSHQFLAKIYMRQAMLDEAGKELLFLKENDKSGTFLTFAISQLDTIAKIRESETKVSKTGASPDRLSPKQFLETPAARHFIQADYEKALEELAALEGQYPQDMTVRRYRGIALDKLQRYEEALAVFGEALAASPANSALHYFKAQTLLHQQKYSEAKNEFEWIIENDKSDAYAPRAKNELKAVDQIIAYMNRPKPKPWSVTLSTGAEPNSNASSESRKPKAIAEEHAVKFPNSVYLNYDLFSRGPWTARANYSFSGTFYSDTLDYLNTISHTLGENLTYVGTLNGKPLISQFSFSATDAVVNHKYYSSTLSPSLTFIYSFTDWHRLTLTERYTYANYKSKGTSAEFTSKKGPSYATECSNNFYFNKEKSLYLQLGYEYGVDDPEGSNNVKDAHTARAGLYFPFLYDWTGNFKFKFKFSDYPEYTNPPATAIRRFDEEYTFGPSITIPLKNKWTLTTQYNYTNVNSKDNAYTYINHSGGATLSYSF